MPDRTAGSLRLLLERSVDYAGLFPPASLGMYDAVANFDGYRQGPRAWMLGRFIVPASRLDELAAAASSTTSAADDRPWELGVLLGTEPVADAERALAFLASSAARIGGSGASIDVAELKVGTVAEVSTVAAALPTAFRYYLEVPLQLDPRPFAAAAAQAGVGVKARTGGVTPDAFPSAGQLAAFLHAAIDANVPFKLTAGLHHPFRGEYRLTYEPDAECGRMFGFLNVFLAAALICAGGAPEDTLALLFESDIASVSFGDSSVEWRGRAIDAGAITSVRRLLSGFGSCSFSEPVDELAAAGLLK